jgi:uncharacterized protein YjdB
LECSKDSTAPTPPGKEETLASAVLVTAPESVLAVGDSMKLAASVRDRDGHELPGVSVVWNSSDTTVLTVSTDAVVHAVRAGAADVTARAGTATGKVYLGVAHEGVVLSSEDSALVLESRKVLTAADPVSAYQTLLEKLTTSMAGATADEEVRRLVSVEMVAAGGVSDIDQINNLEAALGGQSFTLVDPSTSAAVSADVTTNRFPSKSQVPAVESQIGASEPATNTIIYINGVNTDPLGNADVVVALRSMAYKELGWSFTSSSSPHRFRYIYNPTASYSRTASQYCAMRDALNIAGVSLEGAAGFMLPSCSATLDLAQAALQLMNLENSVPLKAQPAALALRTAVKEELTAGRTVTVVAHSQGNLMTQQALSGMSNADLSCVRVISVAAPTTQAWPAVTLKPTTGSETTIPIEVSLAAKSELTEDILLLLGHNQSPPTELVASDLSRAFDKTLHALGLSIPGESTWDRLKFDLALHFMLADYLSQPETRSWIRHALQTEYDGLNDAVSSGACHRKNVGISPASLYLAVDHSGTLTVSVTDDQGKPVSPLPSISWTSLDSHIATVTGAEGQATVTGHATGSTWVIATAEQGADSARVNVQEPSTDIKQIGMAEQENLACAIRNGAIFCWARILDTGTEQLLGMEPPGLFTRVDVGSEMACALAADQVLHAGGETMVAT